MRLNLWHAVMLLLLLLLGTVIGATISANQARGEGYARDAKRWEDPLIYREAKPWEIPDETWERRKDCPLSSRSRAAPAREAKPWEAGETDVVVRFREYGADRVYCED